MHVDVEIINAQISIFHRGREEWRPALRAPKSDNLHPRKPAHDQATSPTGERQSDVFSRLCGRTNIFEAV